MREIELRNRARELVAVALVDDEDYERIAANTWCRNRAGYAVRFNGIYMHREVLRCVPGDGKMVDHVNRDKLDNRRENLRLVTPHENAQNQGGRGGTSRFRGVHWDTRLGSWMASGYMMYRTIPLGRFASEEEAAEVARQWREQNMRGAVD